MVIVYRSGNLTARNFTPRADSDLRGAGGSWPGLSVCMHFEADGKRKWQRLDLAMLSPPLAYHEDHVNDNACKGHVTVAPITANGEVDVGLLSEWAAARDDESAVHPLTQVLLNCVVGKNLRSEP